MNQLVTMRRLIGLRLVSKAVCARSISLGASSYQKEFKPSEQLLQERYELRADEPLDKKRARLLYQSKKRGMLENGVILASFADKHLQTLDAEQLDQYDRLINLPTNDWDIYYWATKTKPTPPEFETSVMNKLREHLHSKVSNRTFENDANDDGLEASDETGRISDELPKAKERKVDQTNEIATLRNKLRNIDRLNPDEVLLPARKDFYDLEPDMTQVSLTDYDKELFDNRRKSLSKKESIVRMTEWRKKFFVHRLKRTLPQPISLRNLSDDKTPVIYTQSVRDKNIANSKVLNTNLKADTNYEKGLKHHNFLQYLMSNDFTDRLDYYEDEAEAWAEMIWHRDYGGEDVAIAPSYMRCVSCNERLHCCDSGLYGYLPKELFATLDHTIEKKKTTMCQRCKFSATYNASLSLDVDCTKRYETLMRELREKPPSIICLLVDLTDFPGSIYRNLLNLIGKQHSIIVVGNKLDLLPHDGPNMITRVTESLRANLGRINPNDPDLRVQDVCLVSARTGFGVEALITKFLLLTHEKEKDIYLVGNSHSGKSTLFNALLQSDLCAIRKGDLLGRVAPWNMGENNQLLKFPITRIEGWEMELKRKRTVRVERNTAYHEQSLSSTTRHRQASRPHMSMLVDRYEYPPICDKDSSSVIQSDEVLVEKDEERTLKFSQDHPLNNISQPNAPLSGERDGALCAREGDNEIQANGCHFHQTPSITASDDQFYHLLTNDERLEVYPHETIIPRRYSVRPLQSIFISGLARLDLLTSQSTVLITIFASRYLPIHVIQTRKADQFYDQFLGSSHLGVPFSSSEHCNAADVNDRLSAWPGLAKGYGGDYFVKGGYWSQGASDIVLGSAGWAMITLGQDQECLVRAFTPEGRGIFRRDPPLLQYGCRSLGGKKIRDTPLFRQKHYKIQRASLA